MGNVRKFPEIPKIPVVLGRDTAPQGAYQTVSIQKYLGGGEGYPALILTERTENAENNQHISIGRYITVYEVGCRTGS